MKATFSVWWGWNQAYFTICRGVNQSKTYKVTERRAAKIGERLMDLGATFRPFLAGVGWVAEV